MGPVVLPLRGLQPVPAEPLREGAVVTEPHDRVAEALLRVRDRKATVLPFHEVCHHQPLAHERGAARDHRFENLVRDPDLVNPMRGVEHREDRMGGEGPRNHLVIWKDADELRVRLAGAHLPHLWCKLLAPSDDEPDVRHACHNLDRGEDEPALVQGSQVDQCERRAWRHTIRVRYEVHAVHDDQRVPARHSVDVLLHCVIHGNHTIRRRGETLLHPERVLDDNVRDVCLDHVPEHLVRVVDQRAPRELLQAHADRQCVQVMAVNRVELYPASKLDGAPPPDGIPKQVLPKEPHGPARPDAENLQSVPLFTRGERAGPVPANRGDFVPRLD